MSRFRNVIVAGAWAVLGSLCLLIASFYWSSFMPVLWPYKTHNTGGESAIICVLPLIVSGLSGICLAKAFRIAIGSRLFGIVLIGVLVGTFVFGKIASYLEEKIALKEGNKIQYQVDEFKKNNSSYPREDELKEKLPNIDWNYTSVHFSKSEWTMRIKGRLIPWYRLNYNSNLGWFYVIN